MVVAGFPFRRVVYASRVYAATLPKRYTIADIAWIGYAPPHEHHVIEARSGATRSEAPPAFTSDSFLVQVRAVEAGLGAMALPELPHLYARGAALVPLRLELGPRALGVMHLIAAKSALDIPRIRRTADLLVKDLHRQSKT